jgi:ankyrin repeat protein
MKPLQISKGWVGILGAAVILLSVGCSGTHHMPTQNDMDMRLIRAAEAGRVEEMKVLLRRGADINATDKDGWTPYIAASSMGRLDAMRILKALGAKTYVDEGALALQ